MKKLCAASIVLLLTLTSCVVSSGLTLTGSGAGTSSTTISANSFFTGLAQDLASVQDTGDLGFFEYSVRQFASSVGGTVTKTSNDDLTVDFAFDDFNKTLLWLTQNPDQSVLTLKTTENNTRKLELNININNYPELQQIIPFLADKDIEVYGPTYNHDYTQEDYIEMMEFIAGEGARDGILSSHIDIQVGLPSSVINTNGTQVNDTCVVFSFPLIDFLMLKEPIQFFVEF